MRLIATLLLATAATTPTWGDSGSKRRLKVSPADESIEYIGRWDFSDPEAPWCAWQGSTIKARFHAESIYADLDCGSNPEFLRVMIDGDPTTSRKLKLYPGRNFYPLATDLSPGEHRVEVVKESYIGEGRLVFNSLHLAGTGTELGLVETEPATPRLRIEFYGDSNLAGYSLEHEQNLGGREFVGCHNTYAGITARMLDAEYQNISCSGAIISGRINSVMSFHNRVDMFKPEPLWDFSRFPADICVVNIGANDINVKSKAEIKRDYLRLLKTLREIRPDAHIVLMNGYGWSRTEPAKYTQEVLDELAEPNVSRLVFPWFFNEWHGCEYDHSGMARYLVSHLESTNPRWAATHESDVMDGFGKDGDVANGSFERMAPFGGFGWRYVVEGVERVQDAQGSADGEYYVRLQEGKDIHQPNHTSPDRRHLAKLMMRGDRGSEAVVRVEFRDQLWRHEIPNTAQETRIPLTQQWKEYEIPTTAPPAADPADRSRDPWQVILRIKSETGTVCVDDVRLSDVD